jgi:hypothetical protein
VGIAERIVARASDVRDGPAAERPYRQPAVADLAALAAAIERGGPIDDLAVIAALHLDPAFGNEVAHFMVDLGRTQAQAEQLARAWAIHDWQMQNAPPVAADDLCIVCNKPLGPPGVFAAPIAPHATWLHRHCMSEHALRRRRTAVAALIRRAGGLDDPTRGKL